MQMKLLKIPDRKPTEKLSVVKNFRNVVENRDISLMRKELYEFLNLYCGFIAHYNIDGFKATYSAPRNFTNTFIRHFDPSAFATGQGGSISVHFARRKIGRAHV